MKFKLLLQFIFIIFKLHSVLTSRFEEWRTVFVDPTDFTVDEDISSTNNLYCSMVASQRQWPYMLKYEGTSCQMSTLKRVPAKKYETPAPGQLLCKTKISPDSKC